LLVLAIDTSGKSFSVAVFDGDQLVRSINSADSARAESGDVAKPASASISLIPMIGALLRDADRVAHDIDLIAVASGPGLFTGLRIGVVAAKTLAYAAEAKIVGVNTLEAIAAQTAERTKAFEQPIWSILNAQRKQLFAAKFRCHPNFQIETLQPDQVWDRSEWMDLLRQSDRVTGSGVTPIRETVESRLTKIGGGTIAPESCWNCHAQTVGRLAIHKFEHVEADNFWSLTPNYYRPSAAEEVFMVKNRKQLP
jgi:tRNA threonylcarbamoyladenosine biosynthesis protein TsaB